MSEESKPAIEWRLAVFASGGDEEVAFILITEDQAKKLGGVPNTGMIPVDAYVGEWKK